VVCGVGTNRGAHEIRRIITNLAVFDFQTPYGGMRLRSLHPGVSQEQVSNATGFFVEMDREVPESRAPTANELEWLDKFDPDRKIRGRVE